MLLLAALLAFASPTSDDGCYIDYSDPSNPVEVCPVVTPTRPLAQPDGGGIPTHEDDATTLDPQ